QSAVSNTPPFPIPAYIEPKLEEYVEHDLIMPEGTVTINTPQETSQLIQIPLPPKGVEAQTNTENHFDAISVLEAKMNNSTTTSILPQEDPTGISHNFVHQQPSQNETIMPIYSDQLKTLNLDLSKLATSDPYPIPKPQIENTNPAQNIQTFHYSSNSTAGGYSFGSAISKVLQYSIISLPLIIVIGSIIAFLLSTKFDLTKVGKYPQWVADNIEVAVKSYSK
ncbi:MAG: hypothetical protein M3P33_02125, partial [bacterium]|nr:hypothetical protein [bacterium]